VRMETLRAYLSTLPPSDQAEYAKRCGTTIGYLRKALSTKPRLDGALVRQLDEQSDGQVSRYDLRPDIFGDAPVRRASAATGATAEAVELVLSKAKERAA
jgi:hypothetical protein